MSTLVTSPRPALPVVPSLYRVRRSEAAWDRRFVGALQALGVPAAMKGGVPTVLVHGEAPPLPGMSVRTAKMVREVK